MRFPTRLLRIATIPVTLLLLASCDDAGSSATKQKNNQQSTTASSSQGNSQKSASNVMVWPPATDTVELAKDKSARNYMLVLDGSGSMRDSACKSDRRESKTVVAKGAATAFIDKVPPEDNIGLITFDSRGIIERVVLGVNNRDALKKEINATLADSGTPLGEATRLAYKKLTEQAQRQLGYGEYHVVLLTDGEAGDTSTLNHVVEEMITRSPVIVHGMGFCIGKNHSLNQPGRTIYKEAGNFKELLEGLESVLAESPDFTVKDFK